MYHSWGLVLSIFSVIFLLVGLIFLLGMNSVLVELVLLEGGFNEFSLYLYFDWVSMLFMGVVGFISSMVLFYSDKYMDDDSGKMKFLMLVLLFVFSMFFMVLSPNMISILLGWDGLGLVSYCLVVFYQNESSNSAGMITVLTNRLGDIGILLSIVMLVNFGGWGIMEFSLSDSMMYLVGVMVLLGAITKSAQIPFSAWLPAAMAAPTPVSALVHSSTLVTAGVYLIIRFSSFYSNGSLSEILMFLSILTMFMSGLGANLETDLKKIIALSTLSQLGVMMMILSVGFYNLAFFHLVTHAIFKAMLFLCAGVVIHGVGGSQDIRSMGLMASVSPYISGMMVLSSFSLMGFPFLSGFYSKDMILEMLYLMNNNFILLSLIFLSTLFTVTYSLRLFYYSMWKGLLDSSYTSFTEEDLMNLPIMCMGLIVIFLGGGLSWLVFPHPVFINLSILVKLLNLLFIPFGVWIYFVQFNFLWKSKELGPIFSFLGLMWFLPSISGSVPLWVLEKSSFYYLEADQAWLEEFGSMGVKKDLAFVGNELAYSMQVNLKGMIIILFLSVLMFFF